MGRPDLVAHYKERDRVRAIAKLMQPKRTALTPSDAVAAKRGRPKTEVRDAMRYALEDRIPLLMRIADDEDATPGDRLKALELLARYGLGTKDELEHSSPILPSNERDARIRHLMQAEGRQRLSPSLERTVPKDKGDNDLQPKPDTTGGDGADPRDDPDS